MEIPIYSFEGTMELYEWFQGLKEYFEYARIENECDKSLTTALRLTGQAYAWVRRKYDYWTPSFPWDTFENFRVELELEIKWNYKERKALELEYYNNIDEEALGREDDDFECEIINVEVNTDKYMGGKIDKEEPMEINEVTITVDTIELDLEINDKQDVILGCDEIAIQPDKEIQTEVISRTSSEKIALHQQQNIIQEQKQGNTRTMLKHNARAILPKMSGSFEEAIFIRGKAGCVILCEDNQHALMIAHSSVELTSTKDSMVDGVSKEFRVGGRDLELRPWRNGIEFDPLRHHLHFCPRVTTHVIEGAQTRYRKTSNILSNSTYTSRVSNFRLSLMGPEDQYIHLSLMPVGIVDYMEMMSETLYLMTNLLDRFLSIPILLMLSTSSEPMIDDTSHRMEGRNIDKPSAQYPCSIKFKCKLMSLSITLSLGFLYGAKSLYPGLAATGFRNVKNNIENCVSCATHFHMPPPLEHGVQLQMWLHPVWSLADFDLERERSGLDEQGMKIAENQETSLKNRRKLAESTRDFRKASTEEKLNLFNSLLKGYQEEVDNLTKRAKFGENAFLNIYQKLYEAPDPCPALASATELSSKVAELESENRKMKHELEEFRTEAAHLKNQQATVRRLEERNRQLEQQLLILVQAAAVGLFISLINMPCLKLILCCPTQGLPLNCTPQPCYDLKFYGFSLGDKAPAPSLSVLG
eukprot:Gb_08468 [translate_table: standard]